ncbi:reverse transcriptase [Caerostris darwini]|uniref:Reverse transcriptase n=1 Tax=Caerostris darwini TaxID=1538125 RepID=A0AAV4MIW3_9ARAC|nr:reverse transcriptase [Caerostris darwini]
MILDENKFSNLGKSLRVTASVKQFVAKLRKKTCEGGRLIVAEIKEVDEYWVRRVTVLVRSTGDRVVESPPFAVAGIDFTGAITTKAGYQSCKKVHIALFTCAVTRAVHIKVVSDMSVKSFLFALRRFLSRRGGCKMIYSYNAKSFRCSCKKIKGFKKISVDPNVQEFISSKGVTWKFNPERSPWWGDFWERLIKSIKEKYWARPF